MCKSIKKKLGSEVDMKLTRWRHCVKNFTVDQKWRVAQWPCASRGRVATYDWHDTEQLFYNHQHKACLFQSRAYSTIASSFQESANRTGCFCTVESWKSHQNWVTLNGSKVSPILRCGMNKSSGGPRNNQFDKNGSELLALHSGTKHIVDNLTRKKKTPFGQWRLLEKGMLVFCRTLAKQKLPENTLILSLPFTLTKVTQISLQSWI